MTRQGGFTVLELLAALAVIAVATSIFVSLYSASLSLAKNSRSQVIAAQLASGYVTAIHTYPGAYEWGPLWALGEGERLKLTDPQSSEVPATMPTVNRAYFHTKSLYENFLWEMFAVRPPEAQPYIEIIVQVRWMHEGRPRLFALTSALPRGMVEDLS